jgi:hypothetical protein
LPYFSKFYRVGVRESIAKEFTNPRGEVDDMMAGLHEIRVRMAEKEYDLKALEAEASLKRAPRRRRRNAARRALDHN